MRPYLDKQSAVLLSIFPSVALGLLNTFYSQPLFKYDPALFWLADIAQWTIFPFFSWLLVLRPNRISISDFGLCLLTNSTMNSIGLKVFVVAMIALWVADVPVEFVANRLMGNHADFGYGVVAAGYPKLWLLSVIYFSVTASLVEEVVFRGLPWLYFSTAISANHRQFWYVFATSIIFAATHSETGPPGMIASLSFGITAALLYAKLRNLWPIVAAHLVIDIYSFWPK